MKKKGEEDNSVTLTIIIIALAYNNNELNNERLIKFCTNIKSEYTLVQ